MVDFRRIVVDFESKRRKRQSPLAQLFAALLVVKYFQVLLVLVSFAALLVVKYPSATGASVFYVP